MNGDVFDIMCKFGQGYDLVFQIEEDGVVVDYSTMQLKSQVRAATRLRTLVAEATISVNNASGLVTARYPVSIPIGEYVYDVICIDGAGSEYTLFEGKYIVRQATTTTDVS